MVQNFKNNLYRDVSVIFNLFILCKLFPDLSSETWVNIILNNNDSTIIIVIMRKIIWIVWIFFFFNC